MGALRPLCRISSLEKDKPLEDFIKTLNKLGPFRLATMGLVTVGILLFFIFVTSKLATTQMSLLYSDLSMQDSNAIVRELETANIPYVVDDVTNKINVDSKQVGRARMLLAEKGLPDGGSIGYEIFDKDEGLSTTRFKQNLNQLRALEGELVRTIATLKPIEATRVHLVLPQRELFSRQAQPASASVFLKIQRGQQLSAEQIMSIQHLVAAAVPQLDPKRVSIVDQNGNLLASGRGDDNTLTGQNIEKMRLSYEQRLITSVEEMVSRIVGFGKVNVNVSAEMDFDQVSTNSESYDPEGQVARSTQSLSETDNETEADPNNVSVENNLPGLPGEETVLGSNNRSSERTEEITNFEISRTVTNHVKEVGAVERLSVAVVVDGSYSKNEEGEAIYTPRTEAEMEQITSLVASAIGFDEDRGDSLEVVNMRFADAEILLDEIISDEVFLGLTKDDIFRISETFILGIVSILVVLLVLRPMVGRLMETKEEDADDEESALLEGGMKPALAGPGGAGGTLEQELPEYEDDNLINLKSVEGKVKASSVKKVNEIIDKHPNESIAIIRSWMFQES